MNKQPATTTAPPFSAEQVGHLVDLVEEAESNDCPILRYAHLITGINEIVMSRLAIVEADIAIMESHADS